jgi:hypothetical protein
LPSQPQQQRGAVALQPCVGSCHRKAQAVRGLAELPAGLIGRAGRALAFDVGRQGDDQAALLLMRARLVGHGAAQGPHRRDALDVAQGVTRQQRRDAALDVVSGRLHVGRTQSHQLSKAVAGIELPVRLGGRQRHG